MKKIITLLALISTISFAAILSNGCSKKLTYKGTLKIKILSAGGVSIYPYVTDYNKLKPIFSSTDAKTSFDLIPGNYMITSRDSKTAVQIQAGETVNLILTEHGFVIDEFP